MPRTAMCLHKAVSNGRGMIATGGSLSVTTLATRNISSNPFRGVTGPAAPAMSEIEARGVWRNADVRGWLKRACKGDGIGIGRCDAGRCRDLEREARNGEVSEFLPGRALWRAARSCLRRHCASWASPPAGQGKGPEFG